MAICKKYDDRVYWSSLDSGTNKTKADYCQIKKLVAFADYKDNDGNGVADDKNLYFRDGKAGLTQIPEAKFG